MPNYAAKSDLKKVTGVDTLKIAQKVDLSSLKSDIDKLAKVSIGLNSLKSSVDKLDVDKLVPVATDLSKLHDAVKNEVVKICV